MADMREELEDGECSASDDDQTPVTNASSNLFAANKILPNQQLGYRSRIPQIVINSDESDNSSDGECPSMWKKSRSPGESFNDCDEEEDRSNRTFINPLLSNSVANSFSGSRRKKNNIWGAVLTEQTLSNEVKTIGMNNPVIHMDSRDVESYDFTKAKEDERPDLDIDPDDSDNRDDLFGEVVDLEKEVKMQESRKRKRNARDRLGKRSYNNHKTRTLGVTAEDTVSEVVSAITNGLSEPKVELFTRIVESIGKELAIKLYFMTEDVEEAGGMMTNNGCRRRTPGGVYIQLLKTDESVSADIIDALFENEFQQFRQQLREKRKIKKAARKKRKQAGRKEMEIDRPDTPTPAEDLEVLTALDSNNEYDAADLPERPATPEPKDDSSDGQEDDDDVEEDDDDEEEDITVAIAKAKAAILKRQREMANRADSDRAEGRPSGPDQQEKMGDVDSKCRDNEMMEDGEL